MLVYQRVLFMWIWMRQNGVTSRKIFIPSLGAERHVPQRTINFWEILFLMVKSRRFLVKIPNFLMFQSEATQSSAANCGAAPMCKHPPPPLSTWPPGPATAAGPWRCGMLWFFCAPKKKWKVGTCFKIFMCWNQGSPGEESICWQQ